MYFVAALGLGIGAVSFQALSYGEVPQRIFDSFALWALLAACTALYRERSRTLAWTLVATGYALLASTIAHHPQPREIIIAQIMAHSLVLAVVVADHAVSSGAAGRMAYPVAALAGSVGGAAVWAAVLRLAPPLFGDDPAWAPEAASPLFGVLHPVYVAALWLTFAGAGVVWHGERQLAARTLQRLRDAELERVRRSREVIESQLQAAQARVEPQFLFDTLSQVRRACGRDPALAERMLDQLVAFLRAAVPRMREPSSTLEEEAALARSYLAVLRMQLGDRLDFSIEFSDRAAHAKLAPMLLLPIVDQVACRGCQPWLGPVELSIAAGVEGDRLTLRVGNPHAAEAQDVQDGAISEIRSRVALLYGQRGSLRLTTSRETGLEAVLSIPYEAAG